MNGPFAISIWECPIWVSLLFCLHKGYSSRHWDDSQGVSENLVGILVPGTSILGSCCFFCWFLSCLIPMCSFEFLNPGNHLGPKSHAQWRDTVWVTPWEFDPTGWIPVGSGKIHWIHKFDGKIGKTHKLNLPIWSPDSWSAYPSKNTCVRNHLATFTGSGDSGRATFISFTDGNRHPVPVIFNRLYAYIYIYHII
jgi:hypothetical protein